MALLSDVIQGVRAWLKAGLGLTDAQIRPIGALYDDDLRPTSDYITVNVRGIQQIGTTEEVLTFSDPNQTAQTRSERVALVSLNAYGDSGFEWLISATLLADHWLANKALSDANLAFPQFSEVRDLSAFMDTDREIRYQIDCDFGISVDSEPVSAPPAESIEVEITLQKNPIDETPDANALVATVPFTPDV